ncbi:MAG: helicase-exonuclease AddAB subunit AddA [bacterium]
MSARPGDPSLARFTPEQREAIVTRDVDVLVSAAAGSGKTSVLVERVIQRLLDPDAPVPVDRMLVVTFTEAAAAEMRQRIAARLERVLGERGEDRAVREQLALLPRASISTIHAFCWRLVREHFHRLGLDPRAAVLDEHEARLTRAEALEAAFEDAHGSEDPGFLALVTSYGGGEAPVAVKALVTALHAYTRSLARPEEWLSEAVERLANAARAGGVHETPYWAPIRAWVARELARLRAELAGLQVASARPGGPAAYAARLAADGETLDAAAAELASAADWPSLVATLAAISFGKLSPVRSEVDATLKDFVQKRRNWVKARVTALTGKLAGPAESEWLADLATLVPHARALVALVESLERGYRLLKKRRAAGDFDDLEHAALAILGVWDPERAAFRPSDVAHELRARFEEVLVDEYQDVNGVQEALLSLVSRDPREASRADASVAGNRFVVGDVKQSIYGFRHTDPGLFLSRLAAYRRDRSGRAIALSANFRSRRAIVAAVNFLFRQVMSEAVGAIPYDEEAALRYGAGYPDPADGSPDARDAEHPVELHLVERGDAPLDAADEAESGVEVGGAVEEPRGELDRWLAEANAAEREAVIAAARARALVEGDAAANVAPAQVWEREGGEWASRPARYGDVVVLLRSIRHRAPSFVSVFRSFHVPVHADVGTGWFAATEIEILLALLATLENPRQDIPLAAVLLSPIGGFRAADLARMRLADRAGDFLDAARAAAGGAGGLDESSRAKLATLLARIEEWRTAARRGPLSRLVWRIYGETRFVDVAGAMPGGEQRRANLLALFDRAREFDHFARQGLARFLAFIAKLRERDEELGAAATLGAGEDVVRVLTVHQSKGLEFPFVIVGGLGSEWNDQELEGDVLFHRDLGLGLRVVDRELKARFASLAHHAVRAAGAVSLRAEEMRILYVALTRARERLILIGSVRGVANERARWAASAGRAGARLPEALVASANRPLDWIAPALARHPDGALLADDGVAGARVAPRSEEPSRWAVRCWSRSELARVVPSASVSTTGDEPIDWARVAALDPSAFGEAASDADEAERAGLARRFAWTYPRAAVAARFAKMSVTELKSRFAPGAPEDEDAAAVAASRIEWPVVKRSRGGAARARGARGEARRAGSAEAMAERPRFLDASRGARGGVDVGIATHAALLHLDPAVWSDRAATAAAVAALVERRVLTEEQAAALGLDAIVSFGASDLGCRLAARPHALRRELPFTLGIPAGEVHPAIAGRPGADDRIVVQGVIDLLAEVEDGSGFLLLDYKTDRVTAAEVAGAAERYRGQMALYARAVTEIFRRPVVESWLCFLTPGVALRI